MQRHMTWQKLLLYNSVTLIQHFTSLFIAFAKRRTNEIGFATLAVWAVSFAGTFDELATCFGYFRYCSPYWSPWSRLFGPTKTLWRRRHNWLRLCTCCLYTSLIHCSLNVLEECILCWWYFSPQIYSFNRIDPPLSHSLKLWGWSYHIRQQSVVQSSWNDRSLHPVAEMVDWQGALMSLLLLHMFAMPAKLTSYPFPWRRMWCHNQLVYEKQVKPVTFA